MDTVIDYDATRFDRKETREEMPSGIGGCAYVLSCSAPRYSF